MKRYGNLFEKAFSIDNLYCAYQDARRGKRGRRACFDFDKSVGANIQALFDEIHSGSYRPQAYFKFIVYEPKQRVIYAPAFRDIVVQHAIYRVIYDIFDRSFIDTSFACRVGYGTHRAANYTRRAMQRHGCGEYVLKLDIRKFFYSINRDILRRLISRKIKDERLVNIMMIFAEMEEPLGIPIGNLLSQIYALIYLNPLDHFVKRVLGVRDYVRYVDDFMLIGLSRPACLLFRAVVIAYLRSELELNLSKSTIQKIKKGVNFCGYRMWKSRVFIRKHSLYKFRKAVGKCCQESINSFLGHAKATNSLIYLLKILKEKIKNGNNIKIPKNYRQIYDALPA